MFKKYCSISMVILLFLLLFVQAVLAEEELTLKEALNIGLKQNSQLKNSLLDKEKAITDLQLAKRYLWPEISIQSTYTRMGNPPQTPLEYAFLPTGSYSYEGTPLSKYMLIPTEYQELSADNYNTAISIQQPIYTGGQALAGIRLAEKGVELSNIQYDKQVSDTFYQIIQSYYNILRAKTIVAIQKSALQVVEEHKRIVKVNIEAGISIKSDLLSIEIERRRLSQSLQEAENNLLLARKRLASILKMEPEKIKLVEPEIIPIIKLSNEKIYQQAFNNRAEFKSLTISSEMTRINKELKSTIYRPAVFLNGNYSWQSDELSFDDGSWNINLTASMPLFDGGKAKKEEEKYSLELEKLKESENSLQDNIRLEIDSILLAIEQAEQSMKLEKLSIENALENLRIANKRYKMGVGTNVDVINAQNNLQQSKIRMTQAKYNYTLKLFELLYKTGKLTTYCKEVK